MNQLVEALIKPFLTEAESDSKEVIAVIPGGYKPPTLGHFYLASEVAKKPEVDKTLILIGHKERNNITKEDSAKIWDIYKRYLPGNVEVKVSQDPSPVKELFSLIGDNPDKYFVLVVGVRSEEDLKDIRRFDNLKKKFDNLKVVTVKGEDAIRGTNARQAILDKDYVEFNRFLPVELNDQEREEIWKDLTGEVIQETYKGKRTNDGAPGTFKAKITKAYGGPVTIEKAKKFKNRQNATPHDKRQANWFINFHSKNEAITPDQLKAADAFADKQLAPIDVDLTSKHFFDRLQGRGEDISYAQLIGFFKRLGKHKQGFFDFFNKYKEIVASDDRTDLNIPFLNMANKAIAKTIMKKDDFQTTNPQLTFEEEGKAAPYGSGYKPVQETLMPYIAELTGYMVENGLSIDDAPEVHFIEDEENAQDIFGRTAYYNSQDKSITLYVTGRHPKDILRSFAHEMIHYYQDCEGRLHNVSTVDINEDDRLKELEREAYERGNLYFRGWENSRSKEPLREGSYDSITRQVVKDVLEYWKKNFHGQDDEDIIYEFEYDFMTPKGHQIEFELNAGLLLRQTEEHTYHPDGGINQDFDPPYMELNFQVDPRDLPQAWSKIYEDLTDVVRHEIEHLTQMGLNVIDSKELPDDQMIRKMIDADLLPKAEYFKLESEIDAMLQGMYLKAKKTKTPFADVLHTYLDKQPISKEDKEVILDLWRSRRKALSLPEF